MKRLVLASGNAIGTGFMLKVPKAVQPYWKAWTEWSWTAHSHW